MSTSPRNRTLLRRSLAALGVLVLLAGGTVAFALARAEYKQGRHIELPVADIALPADPASLERGRYLFLTRGCIDCHGSNGGGRVLAEDKAHGLLLRGPNISPGSPTVANYRVADWVRAIRHGIKPDGRPALVMPSDDYNRLSDEDLGALIAHLRSMPPAVGGPAVLQMPLPLRAMYGLGLVKDAAERIDHTLPPSPPTRPAVSVENGRYVAQMCIGCHGPGYGGGRIPGAPPDWPAAANLTPGSGSAMGAYRDAAAFAAMMRSGRRPDGTAVSPVMPFTALRQMDDTELQAMYAFLQTLPPREHGQR